MQWRVEDKERELKAVAAVDDDSRIEQLNAYDNILVCLFYIAFELNVWIDINYCCCLSFTVQAMKIDAHSK